MIVVTGLGRSGTSLVAQLYKELGFDPGGVWQPEVRAGYEDEDIVRANANMATELHISMTEDKWTHEHIRRLKPEHANEQNGLVLKGRELWESVALRMLGRSATQVEMLPWERFEEMVAKWGPRLVELAESRAVVKDPRFTWTLPMWVAAGAPIEHVLVCTRNVEAIVESRSRASHIVFHTPGAAKNAFIYGFGLCMTTLIDARIAHNVVRFPDFASAPDELYEAMRFPSPVAREKFREAFERVFRQDFVHDER